MPFNRCRCAAIEGEHISSVRWPFKFTRASLRMHYRQQRIVRKKGAPNGVAGATEAEAKRNREEAGGRCGVLFLLEKYFLLKMYYTVPDCGTTGFSIITDRDSVHHCTSLRTPLLRS